MAQNAIGQTPPACRLTPEQAALIARNAEPLVAMGPEITAAFYDTLYAHRQTAEIFVDGERPMREKTFMQWWERTVRGPLDDDYWAWMAMVGLAHVARKVTNPMMLAMADFVAAFIGSNTHRLDLSEEDRRGLVDAFERVASVMSMIITYGHDRAVSAALFERSGMPSVLLTRLGEQTVREALADAKTELAL